MSLSVLIIGAGLGGLCLAQMLRRAGIDAEVFERDVGPAVRAQGYRLHLDADGVGALKESLPPDLFALFEATSMRPLPYTTLVDTGLALQKRFHFDEYSGTKHHVASGSAEHLNVNRATLRQILMAGMQDVIRYGAELVRYESDGDGVTAQFSNGMAVHGDLLIGADGIRSAVRAQRAPEAQTMDTGLRSLYGRLPMTQARKVLPGYARADAFTIAVDVRKLIMGLGPMRFPMRPEFASENLAPQARLPGQDDYVAFILAGRREYFSPGDDALRKANSDELQQIACDLLRDWPESSAVMPTLVEPGSFFFVEMFTSIPFALAPSPNVTLLGDAIHAMSPSLGRGANIALRDAAQLGRHLIAVKHGSSSLREALRAYELEMTHYGFAVVRQSVEKGWRLLGQEPLPS